MMPVQSRTALPAGVGDPEKVLGPEHPDTANCLNNLAGLYEPQGQYAKPEPLYQRALAIREKALGPEHPALATSLENFASLLRNMGRPEEATPLEDRAKTIRAKNAWLEIPVTNLGDNHPHFLRAPHLDVECFAEISRFLCFSPKMGLADSDGEPAKKERTLSKTRLKRVSKSVKNVHNNSTDRRYEGHDRCRQT
jgi:tetratricopeptide (TPR) repeat protein